MRSQPCRQSADCHGEGRNSRHLLSGTPAGGCRVGGCAEQQWPTKTVGTAAEAMLDWYASRQQATPVYQQSIVTQYSLDFMQSVPA